MQKARQVLRNVVAQVLAKPEKTAQKVTPCNTSEDPEVDHFIPISEIKRIRVRIWLDNPPPSARPRNVKLFTINYEVFLKDWIAVVRHCNFYENSSDIFHTHVISSLEPLQFRDKIAKRLKRRVTPEKQMEWAIKDIRTQFRTYDNMLEGVSNGN